jgi:glycosyltransferase involved in cell wall biosynthesis
MSTPSDRTAAGRLSRQLLDVKPAAARRRRPSEGPLRVLHLLSQQPGKTGSGVALLAMVRHGAEAGYRQHAVIGIPGEEPLPGMPPLAPDEITAVRFDRPPVPFPVPGMSDIMPYRSTRFSTFTESMLEGYLWAFSQALTAAARNFTPDIIHANHLWLLTALARVLFPSTPLCVSSHGTELRQLEKAPQLAPFVRPACAAADRVFALHAANRSDVIRAYGISPERVCIVGAGFRSELFRPAPAPPPSGGRMELVVAYAGKISAPKGVPWLIDAMRRVESPLGRRVTLLLAGAAAEPGAEAIQRRAEDLDNVVFLGALSQEELAKVLQAADLFVLPSFFEGLPLVVVEALACECRVVMTELKGMETWMPAGLCAEGVVETVALPRLVGTDTPVAEDLPRFVADLAGAITRQLARAAACEAPPATAGSLQSLTWKAVFDRVAAAYRELAGLGFPDRPPIKTPLA